jgi:hypothetical protein
MLASRGIRKALWTALKNDPTLMPIIGGMFQDAVPAKYDFRRRSDGTLPKPYIVFADLVEKPWRTFGTEGAELTATIHVYSRWPGADEALTVMQAVTNVLDEAEFTVEGYGVVRSTRDVTEVLRDDDADGAYRVGVVRFTLIVLSTADDPPPPPSVASVIVSPPLAAIEPGSAVELAASVADADGTPMERAVAWSSTDADVATVDAEGVVTGVTHGTAAILATADGVTGASVVSVVPADLLPPPPLTLLTSGVPLDGLVAAWDPSEDGPANAIVNVLGGPDLTPIGAANAYSFDREAGVVNLSAPDWNTGFQITGSDVVGHFTDLPYFTLYGVVRRLGGINGNQDVLGRATDLNWWQYALRTTASNFSAQASVRKSALTTISTSWASPHGQWIVLALTHGPVAGTKMKSSAIWAAQAVNVEAVPSLSQAFRLWAFRGCSGQGGPLLMYSAPHTDEQMATVIRSLRALAQDRGFEYGGLPEIK